MTELSDCCTHATLQYGMHQSHAQSPCCCRGAPAGRRRPFTDLLHVQQRRAAPALRLSSRCHAAQQSGGQHGEPAAQTAHCAESSPRQDFQRAQQYVEVSAAPGSPQQQAAAFLATPKGAAAAVALAGITGLGLRALFNRGSRAYEDDNSVGKEYDSWTNEGILEAYWGEHIHLGYYNEQERAAGYKKKDFKLAKFDFVDEMLAWGLGDATAPQRILDVGCGFGGTSRHLAKKFGAAQVEGITLSKEQVRRGTELAKEQGVSNAHFQVMDALKMEWPDNSFDLVWACESGEHMPDKKLYVEEMTRVLKPGGTMIIATWCQREETPDTPFTDKERAELDFLYTEWAHPYFISIQEYSRLMQGTGQLERVETADWTAPTLPSWRHSIWVGVYNPWPVILKLNPLIWYKVLREIVTLERMHRAFDSGLMQYGMMKAVKKSQ